MTLKVEKYAITTQTSGVPLVCCMKRYTRRDENPERETTSSSRPRTILLRAHGAGFCKETWEPVIEDLFQMDPDVDNTKLVNEGPGAVCVTVDEAWALDSQNHGEACTLNEDVLVRRPGITTIWDYADAFATLYRSGLLDPHKRGHNIVLCGHSAGSIAATLSTSFFNPPSQLPFSHLILVDPPMWAREREREGHSSELYKRVEAMTPIRRDVWKTYGDAVQWMKGSLLPSWDRRVFDIYTKHGLRSLPTAFYPDKKSGVTLTTHRMEENFAFTGMHYIRDAVNRLDVVCEYVPVHLIYGGKSDMFTREVQDSLISPKDGRNFASIRRLEDDVGHLVVQEAPTQLASAILDVLRIRSSGGGGQKVDGSGLASKL